MDEVRAGRVIAIPLIVMMLVAGLGLAAPIVVPPEPETLVEGHSVFTVVEQVTRSGEARTEYAAAVAVLVREICWDERSFRFPGVVWFNDQYLVNPKRTSADTSAKYRYPATGAVIAVPRGDPNPTLSPAATFVPSNYVETYRITDPNDWPWEIDKWMVNGRPVWTVAINNNGAGYGTPDNGGTPQCDSEGSARGDSNLCAGMNVYPWDYEDRPSPYNDTPSADRRDRTTCTTPVRGVLGGASAGTRSSGEHGYNYICGGRDTSPKTTCSSLQYNALLFFFLRDLEVAGTPKNHTAGSTDRAGDVSGCASDTPNTAFPDHNSWSCPGANDAREGNSHAYRPSPAAPFNQWPWMTSSGRDNHGGSADCTGDGANDQYCHATRQVDIYYSYAALPPRTAATTLFRDTEGMTAPYHCHETTNWCNQRDFFEDQNMEDPFE